MREPGGKFQSGLCKPLTATESLGAGKCLRRIRPVEDLNEVREQTREGVVIIKGQRYRSQDRNRADALARLQALVDSAASIPRPRRETRPTLGSQRRRVDSKVKRGQIKAGRRKILE